ncbi:recombinase family protein [Pseudonocardia thermophila]|uniref:recombinase family protein n=1 Tax=Pseudonocardia thermophila TaxID=1848 RepID=UPI00248EAF90|nr:recombinase family protein [Pseudonocardia thermophila]
MRAHVYTRLSQDRAGDELGVARQREDCLRLVELRGWTLASEHSDNDTSANGKVRRPAFDALLGAVRRDEVDAIVAWSLDRLVRTARDRLALVEACREHGVTIALVRGTDMDASTPAGRLALGILGEVAQHELDVKSDRQRRAAEQAAKLGKAPVGPRAFGFTLDRTEHVPAEAEAIREAYSAVLAGASLRSIADAWNAAGLTSGRTRTGRNGAGRPSEWTPEAVRVVLANPRNCAIRTYNGVEVGPAQWPAIVPEETFRAVHAILTDPSRRTGPPAARRLLSGVAICGKCGARMVSGTTYHGRPTYRCETKAHVSRTAPPIDEYVQECVVERLSRPDAAELLAEDDQPARDVPALRERAQALRARLDALAVEFADGELTAAQLRTATARVRENLAAVERELAEAGRTSALAPLVAAEDVAAVWKRLDVGRRRTVIDLLMTVTLHSPGKGKRTFDPSTVQIEWRQRVSTD